MPSYLWLSERKHFWRAFVTSGFWQIQVNLQLIWGTVELTCIYMAVSLKEAPGDHSFCSLMFIVPFTKLFFWGGVPPFFICLTHSHVFTGIHVFFSRARFRTKSFLEVFEVHGLRFVLMDI